MKLLICLLAATNATKSGIPVLDIVPDERAANDVSSTPEVTNELDADTLATTAPPRALKKPLLKLAATQEWAEEQKQGLAALLKDLDTPRRRHVAAEYDEDAVEPPRSPRAQLRQHRRSKPVEDLSDFENAFRLGAPDAAPSRDDVSTSGSEEDGDAGDSDSYAMMMFYKGRLASLRRDNRHLHKMLGEASRWSHDVKAQVPKLDAEKRENARLKVQIKTLSSEQAALHDHLQQEAQKEKESQKRVQALEWVRQRLDSTQLNNAGAKAQLAKATQLDQQLEKQIDASQGGRRQAEASARALAQQVHALQQKTAMAVHALAAAKKVTLRQEAALKTFAKTSKNDTRLHELVRQRDHMLNMTLTQMLEEKQKEKELTAKLAQEKLREASNSRAASRNTAALEESLKLQSAKLAKLKNSYVTMWKKVTAGGKARKVAEENAHKMQEELSRVQALDLRAKNQTQHLLGRISAQRLTLASATRRQRLANEAREAASRELNDAQATIKNLNQQQTAVLDENHELAASLSKVKREESQLMRDAMGSVTDAGGINLTHLDIPEDAGERKPAVEAAQASPADLPSIEIAAQ